MRQGLHWQPCCTTQHMPPLAHWVHRTSYHVQIHMRAFRLATLFSDIVPHLKVKQELPHPQRGADIENGAADNVKTNGPKWGPNLWDGGFLNVVLNVFTGSLCQILPGERGQYDAASISTLFFKWFHDFAGLRTDACGGSNNDRNTQSDTLVNTPSS